MKNLSELTLQQKTGQLLFFGFDGYTMNEHALHAIREQHIGNVILFARNFQTLSQLSRLIQDLQKEALRANGIPLFVAIDHEGGSVNRLTRDFTWFPGSMAVSAAGETSLAYDVGYKMGVELASCGINLNLAPVVDIADHPDSLHIGSRSFGDTPDKIAPYSAAFIRGLQQHLPATAKHFPSIGDSKVDLHLALGRNEGSMEQLSAHELLPVRHAVEAGVSVVMTSHEIYPAIEDCPGTLSYRLLTDCLRNQFGFRGLIISDCMEMKALCSVLPTPDACVRALAAGVDLLLVCHTKQTQDASSDALTAAVQDGRISPGRLAESVERILDAKQKLPFSSVVPADVLRQHRLFASGICDNALTVTGDPDFFVPTAEEQFLLIAPPPAALTMLDEEDGISHLAAAVHEVFPHADCVEYHFPMTEQECLALAEQALNKTYTRIYLALYQAHQDPFQRKLLEQLSRGRIPTGSIILRSPYDLRWCAEVHATVLTYDYTPPMLSSLIRFMKGELSAPGRLPVTVSIHTEKR